MVGKAQRFIRDVVTSYAGDECLIWPFATDGKGYGVANMPGRSNYVHRLACELANGPPPSLAHEAAHNCGKGHTGCCNPKHLRWATRQENKDDEVAHGVRNRGERQGHSKLTEVEVREIIALKGIISQKEIGFKYGVSDTTIGEIHRGKNWYWITQEAA